MCVGPDGVSVGLRYHALWNAGDPPATGNAVCVAPLRIAPDPNQFHLLARKDDKPVDVEQLKLGQWMSISGAAFTTGAGRGTEPRAIAVAGIAQRQAAVIGGTAASMRNIVLAAIHPSSGAGSRGCRPGCSASRPAFSMSGAPTSPAPPRASGI